MQGFMPVPLGRAILMLPVKHCKAWNASEASNVSEQSIYSSASLAQEE